jgi:signal transduction histidine kinase
MWLAPKRVDLVTSAFYLSVPIFYSLYTKASSAQGANATFWWTEGLILSATIVLLSIDRLEYWFYGETIPVSTAVILLAIRMLFIEIVAQLDRFAFSPFLYFLVPLIAVLYFGDWPGYALAALAWIVYIVKHILHSPGWLSNQIELQYFGIFTLGLVFSITMAQIVNRESASRARAEHVLAELAVSHQQLKDYTRQAVELAGTNERNRLARDIHDSLGHYLTVINVQLEKALVFHNASPQEADQAVRDAKALASDALQDVRRSVSTLRATSHQFSAHAALGLLIEHMQGGQLTIELRVAGSEEGFSEESLMALFRAAQEGLTNVQKHARATNARLDLQFGEEEAVLQLSDNGQGFDPTIPQPVTPGREGGYGLQGVHERAQLIGGWFKLESAPDRGTRLTLHVPKATLTRD